MAKRPTRDPALYYPGALYVPDNPANNGSTLDVADVRLIVVHVAQASSQSSIDSWFGDPRAQVSAHFSVSRLGRIHQYVPLNRVAWAQEDYNGVAWSIEHVGFSGQRLTHLQIDASIRLMRYLHKLAPHVPLHRTANPDHAGVIGHGELGVAGGNHPDCPGTPILYQFNVALRPNMQTPHWWHYKLG